jgi:hypothetical protein
MRFGLLSDEYIKKQNPAFFPSVESKRKNVRRIKKSVIPYYDLFSVAQVTLQNPYELIDEYTELSSLPSFFDPSSFTPRSPTATPDQKSKVSTSSNFWMGGSPSSSTDDSVRLLSFGEEEGGPNKKTMNALKKLRTDMIGETTGGAPNIYTQSSPFKISSMPTIREDELAEFREDLEAATTERPPSARNTRGTAPGEFFLLPLYRLLNSE